MIYNLKLDCLTLTCALTSRPDISPNCTLRCAGNFAWLAFKLAVDRQCELKLALRRQLCMACVMSQILIELVTISNGEIATQLRFELLTVTSTTMSSDLNNIIIIILGDALYLCVA